MKKNTIKHEIYLNSCCSKHFYSRCPNISHQIRLFINKMYKQGILNFVVPDKILNREKCADKIKINISVCESNENVGPCKVNITKILFGNSVIQYVEIDAVCYVYNGFLQDTMLSDYINEELGYIYELKNIMFDDISNDIIKKVNDINLSLMYWQDCNDIDSIWYILDQRYTYKDNINENIKYTLSYKKYLFIKKQIYDLDYISDRYIKYLGFLIKRMYCIAKRYINYKEFIIPVIPNIICYDIFHSDVNYFEKTF